MKLNGRIPVIALPYSEKHKAVPKELLVDYETGNIYVVSATDKSVIFNITSKILEKLDSVTGDKIIVNIEGIGNVNLQEYINSLKLEFDDMVTISDEGKDIYIPKEERLDNFSLESKFKRIQIKNFETAENGMIPQKYNNTIRWIYPPESDADTGSGGNDSDPTDGLETEIIPVEPIEGKIFLRASRRLVTKNLTRDVLLILPRTLDQYCEIYWNMRAYQYKPTIKFGSSILFNGPYQPSENAFNIYKFATWDGGGTWFGTLDVFVCEAGLGGESGGSNINIEYLEKNYYSKQDIDDNYYNKLQLENMFINREQLDSLYLTKDQIEEGYFTKEKVEELLSWHTQTNSQIKLPQYILNKSK